MVKSFKLIDVKRIEQNVYDLMIEIYLTMKRSVAPIVTQVEENGRQVPRDRGIPRQVNDAIIVVDVQVQRVF